MRIIHYRTSSGREPVREYFEKLPVLDRARFAEDLEIISGCFSIDDLKISQVTVRQLDGKLWEIKTGQANKYRVYYVILTDLVMVLLHACKKQSQKAAKHDLEIGKKRMMEVLS